MKNRYFKKGDLCFEANTEKPIRLAMPTENNSPTIINLTEKALKSKHSLGILSQCYEVC